ncbi:DNA recombination protein RecO [Elizabethkingia argentiflava]|uniref:DNA recombination protein RecO n=1 Tax=Elizabethkingia argenteiflava TaxID=2681556 RepID=A0A845PP83_9FLAO|nr:recombination protein O N-terminal domain-containing protein [Elizabethkingia argenteiflava]NAW50149.1 DNA recombination protein RecO [Elizabethkingia argenteiflava]
MVEDKGFLISYLKYGDTDAVLHIYTYSEGYKSYFLKGIYAKKNKKKALLHLLVEISFFISPSKASKLPSISHLQIQGDFPEENIKTSALQFFTADMLSGILRNEGQNMQIYGKIYDFLNEIKDENLSAHIHFFILLTQDLGIKPLFLKDALYLNPHQGVFEMRASHHVFDEKISSCWRQILEKGYRVKLDTETKRKLLESILVYYSLHLPDFKHPVSLDVLQQIWQ